MEHMMLVQKIKRDMKQKYIDRHQNPWPEFIKVLKDCGMKREFIWNHGDYFYLYIMAEDLDKTLKEFNETEIFQKWMEEMGPTIEIMKDIKGKTKGVELEKVFDFEASLEEIEGNE